MVEQMPNWDGKTKLFDVAALLTLWPPPKVLIYVCGCVNMLHGFTRAIQMCYFYHVLRVHGGVMGR